MRRPGGRPGRARLAMSLLAFCAFYVSRPWAQTQPPPAFEHEVKASFVYTVAKFVDWPPEAFEGPDTPLVFAILGDDPIEEPLLRTVQGKSVGGHPVHVIKLKDEADPEHCHVLFVGRSEADHVDEVLAKRRDSSVLTVGEFDRFAQRGGVLRIILEQNMVRFEVNVDAASRAHLQISSKILKLGRIVRERKRAAGSP
jgi:hypothetical protein